MYIFCASNPKNTTYIMQIGRGGPPANMGQHSYSIEEE